MKVAVVGASGQVGSLLCRALDEDPGFSCVPLDHAAADVTNLERLQQLFRELRPSAVCSTAAFHNVEACERDPDAAFRINALGARNLALACREVGASLLWFSTDYVFGGDKTDRTRGYTEFDPVGPKNTYARSKLAGEQYIRSIWPNHFIVRTAWLFGALGSRAKGGNFVTTMLRLGKERRHLRVIDDQVGSPTSTAFLALQILLLLRTERFGTVHAVCSGSASWCDLAREIFRLARMDVAVLPVSTEEYGQAVPRPRFSVLENYVLSLEGMNRMPPWQEALERYLRELLC